MSALVCGGFEAPDPDDPCCYGAAFSTTCTCWTEVTDPPVVAPRTECVEGPNPLQPAKCHDCAYRPGSQEREDGTVYDADLPTGRDRPFYCHQGMPRTVAFEHPSGARQEVEEDSYTPVQGNGRAWCADGTPAPLCAGWAGVAGVTR